MSAANVIPLRPDQTYAYRLSDVGNAERFARDYGDDLRFVCDAKLWYRYDGTRWAFDATGRVTQHAKAVVSSLYVEASYTDDADSRKDVLRHASASERANRIRDLLTLAQSEPPFPIVAEQFDADPWLLNCANGTIDLRTAELRSHNRDDLITKTTGVAFDREATCPRWERFLADIMGDDVDKLAFLQRMVGYCATGDTSEQCFFMPYGHGRNGKSTFVEAIRRTFGDYALAIDAATLMVRQGSGPREDLARLKGARFVSAVEAGDGVRLDDGRVKNLTGTDPVTARHLYVGSFSFMPTFKLLLATNHKPVIRDTSLGMWRRVRLVPFTVTIPEDRVDPNLLDALLEERPGILAWIIAGSLQWRRERLGMPCAIREATEAYRADSDAIGKFIDEQCDRVPDARERGGALYAAFQRWCEASGERRVMNSTAFGRALEDRGHDVKKERDGKYRLGIRLRV